MKVYAYMNTFSGDGENSVDGKDSDNGGICFDQLLLLGTY
jgi:hypothetical protein